MSRVSALACFALVVMLSSAPAQAELRAYAGAVAGNAGNGTVFGCATSGPSIAGPWFSGISIPTEGIAPCGLSGGIEDKTSASGPISAGMSVVGPMANAGGVFTGSAQARADYWSLGVAAEATATGGSSPSTFRQAAAFASFTETLIYSSTTVAPGTAGYTNFSFLIDGLLKNQPNLPYTQQGDINLSIRVNNGPGIWTSFAGTVVNNGTPYLRGGSTGLPGSFVLSPGAFEGSAVVSSTANFAFVWGAPFTVQVAMIVSVSPCCFGTSMTADFYNSAVLDGIDAYAGGNKVGDFIVMASSGALLGAGGVVARPVPEPATPLLAALGLALIAGASRRMRRGSG